MRKTALVLAAHPDDEVLGCGGTIARLAAEGEAVHVAFLADGVLARGDEAASVAECLEARRQAARAACRLLGAASVSFGEFPDNRMDTVALLDLAKEVERLLAVHAPATVLTHHGGDLNIDHRRLHEAAATACRPQRDCCVRSFLCFEVPSSTEWRMPGSGPAFEPTWFVDITAVLDRKLAALEVYADELRGWPHPRSVQGVRHLAHWRGASVGMEAAEAFVLGRQRV